MAAALARYDARRQAVSTPAFGRLRAEHVVHAVAPDSELATRACTRARRIAASGVERHSATLPVEGRHPSWRQFTPPDAFSSRPTARLSQRLRRVAPPA